MKLVAGLGNPGKEYEHTYHNIGFDALDTLAARFCAPNFSEKQNALVTDISVAGEKVYLLKPLTYMNLSGDAISYFSRYYKIPPRDILVVYDDIDIEKGTVRARLSGSSGTHNGMRDIVAKLGTTDFARVRIGTGLKPPYIDLVNYVLKKSPKEERPLLESACALACDFAEEWLLGKQWQEMTKDCRCRHDM